MPALDSLSFFSWSSVTTNLGLSGFTDVDGASDCSATRDIGDVVLTSTKSNLLDAPTEEEDEAGDAKASSPKPAPATAARGRGAKACQGVAPEPRAEAPPLWKTTVRAAPDFAGSVAYQLPDSLEKLEVPITATGEDPPEVFYVGMYTDLRERLALLQRTLDYEGYNLVARHRDHGVLTRATAERERNLKLRLRRLTARIEMRKDVLRQWNLVQRRQDMPP